MTGTAAVAAANQAHLQGLLRLRDPAAAAVIDEFTATIDEYAAAEAAAEVEAEI